MIIRYLNSNDIVQHDKVSSQAFSISCDINDKSSVLPCEKMLGAFGDDNVTLFADLEINERKCVYGKHILKCKAIGGVAAKPEHRGKGAVKAMFEYLNTLDDSDISILYPFSDAYYKKFGYESAGYSVKAVVPFACLKDIKRNCDAQLYEGNKKDELLSVYNRCASKHNLCFLRENADAFSNEPYLSKAYTYVYKNRAFATILIDREKSVVEVKEIYFDSCEAMLGMLGFLRNFEGNQKSVVFDKIPCNSPILNYISDTKECKFTLFNTGSARINNIENVLKLHDYGNGKGNFCIEVENERYCVSFDKDIVKVEKDSNAVPDAVMNINSASKILLNGIASPDEADYIENLQVNNKNSDFFSAFKPVQSFFTDEF